MSENDATMNQVRATLRNEFEHMFSEKWADFIKELRVDENKKDSSIKDIPYKATDRATLEARLMSPMVPKTELEWYAKRRVERLEEQRNQLKDITDDWIDDYTAVLRGEHCNHQQLNAVKKAIKFYEDWARLFDGTDIDDNIKMSDMYQARADELRLAFGLEAE